MLLARGDRADHAQATELRDEAIARYRLIGMPRHEAMAVALRARCGEGSGPGDFTGRSGRP